MAKVTYKFADNCPTSTKMVKNKEGLFVPEKFKAVMAFGNIVDEEKLNSSEALVNYLLNKPEVRDYIIEVKSK